MDENNIEQSLTERIEALLPQVMKPGRYLGTEIGAIIKDWETAPGKVDQTVVKWLLILPDVYEIGMSHQGLRILYDILNRRDDALAERAFAPWVDMEDLMRSKQIPLFSLETRHEAAAFDVVGFSLQYELLATNIINLLDLASIPLRSTARSETDPLIAAGGPCTGNPEPLAEFIDFFIIGDGEDAVGHLTTSINQTRGLPREERLYELTRIPGIYVPRFYEPVYSAGRQCGVRTTREVPLPVKRTYLPDLTNAPYPEAPVIPLVEAVQDRLTLEIQRGCTRGCRFCQAGIFYRPVRHRSAKQLANLVSTGLPASGWNEVSLSSLSSADYPQIGSLTTMLVNALEPERIGLSFSSLRIDAFSIELAELVSRVRKTGFTFAPEAGTQRLRDVINKGVNDADLFSSVEAAYAKGWQRVKLYFMVGLPTETEADIDGIIDLVGRIRTIGRKYGGNKKVTASIGPFVPKPHTPFQWEAFTDRFETLKRQQTIKDHLQSRWSQVKWHDPNVSFIEAIISRGDRTLTPLFERVWRAGARFDGWAEFFNIDRWLEAMAAEKIDPAAYTGAIDPGASLPWDHISLGAEKRWLLKERERALSQILLSDCRLESCDGCGVGCPRPFNNPEELSPADWLKIQDQISTAITGPKVSADTVPGPESIHRYRIVFTKLGRLRFISHLETARLFARIFRMAQWPLAYSQGHHPHPKIAFGPPLPLGVEGAAELIDVQLISPMSADLIQQANQHSPIGFKILGARLCIAKPVSLAADAAAAAYQVQMPQDLYHQAISEQRLEHFVAADSVIMHKSRKGRQKTIDLKRCVQNIEWIDQANTCSKLADAQPGQTAPQLKFLLLLQEPLGHIIGPLPVLTELFKWSAYDLGRSCVTRMKLFDKEGEPLNR